MSSDNSSSDDEVLQLSAATMHALLEFYSEQQEREDKLREIEEGNIPETFEENWVRKRVDENTNLERERKLIARN